MLRPLGPMGRIERFEPPCQGYAFVFQRVPLALTTALAFTEDPDRVLLGLEQPWDRGTTPATLVPLLRLLTRDPFAELLVIPPGTADSAMVYAGPAATLARRIQQLAPACWAALAPIHTDDEAIGRVYPTLNPSDLVRDVLVHTPGR